jgi:hypothetical protein
MAPEHELGTCRHCEHWPVHASARWCPACGGLAPFTRTPPPKNRNWLVAVLALIVILLAAAAAFWFSAR